MDLKFEILIFFGGLLKTCWLYRSTCHPPRLCRARGPEAEEELCQDDRAAAGTVLPAQGVQQAPRHLHAGDPPQRQRVDLPVGGVALELDSRGGGGGSVSRIKKTLSPNHFPPLTPHHWHERRVQPGDLVNAARLHVDELVAQLEHEGGGGRGGTLTLFCPTTGRRKKTNFWYF